MISLARGGLMAFVSGFGVWVFAATFCKADDGISAGTAPCPKCRKVHAGHHGLSGPGGVAPGFQGFGIGYHLGHGYGGNAGGVGADGGYPFYGGPGYPHSWPCLRRFGGIVPFPYYGGPGGPSADGPNYFGSVGPLTPDNPVVTIESDPRDPAYTGGYGCFNGMIPYPETTFAPFEAEEVISTSGVSSASPRNAPRR
jgi:hypothetical protein